MPTQEILPGFKHFTVAQKTMLQSQLRMKRRRRGDKLAPYGTEARLRAEVVSAGCPIKKWPLIHSQSNRL